MFYLVLSWTSLTPVAKNIVKKPELYEFMFEIVNSPLASGVNNVVMNARGFFIWEKAFAQQWDINRLMVFITSKPDSKKKMKCLPESRLSLWRVEWVIWINWIISYLL